jgi:glutathione synthase/RimK-type ligase-like ATP-grasp enzyme
LRALIYTIKNDLHAATVAWALAQRGAIVSLFFSADFPSRASSSVRVNGGNSYASLTHDAHESQIRNVAYDAIWHRRLSGPVVDASAHESDAPFILQEADAYLAGVRAIVDNANANAFRVNALQAREAARSKIWQLQVASSCGWDIPETLVSNDQNEIAKFVADIGAPCIAKPLTGHAWNTESGGRVATQTFVVDQTMLRDPGLRLSPLIFQREIRKHEELRIVVMGRTIFTCAINTDAPRTDWRVGEFNVSPPLASLSVSEREKIFAVMDRLGLVFGCFDVIREINGKSLFIEVNEMGQFLFLERRNPEVTLLDAFTNFVLSCDPNFEYKRSARPLSLADYHGAQIAPDVLEKHADFSRNAVTNEAVLAPSR